MNNNLQEFKPQLAIDINKVKRLPQELMCSDKYDGIRCTVFDGVAYSRSLKLLPNLFIQEYMSTHGDILDSFDGEIIIGNPFAKDVFSQSTSGVMRVQEQPDFKFYVFDMYLPGVPFYQRYKRLKALISVCGLDRVVLVEHKEITQESIEQEELQALERGAEGLMLNNSNGMYKCGRSGTKQPELMKVKRFKDEEFLITGYEPKYHNTNEATTNELGRTARSSHKGNLVPLDTLGALVLVTKDNKSFNVGTGFDDKLRKELWDKRQELIGKYAKIKHFEIGAVEVPRLPVFLNISEMMFIGLRNEMDMS